MDKTILEVKDLSVSFTQYGRGMRTVTVEPVKSLHLRVRRGEIHGMIGASGSGKSLLAHAVMGILPTNATVRGEMVYDGKALTQERIEALRGREIAFIPQSVNYLDPLMAVKKQVRIGLPKQEAKSIQERLFATYGLEREAGDLYPFQLSGGMLRRVLFATSIRHGIKLIIADEPTPGIHPEALETMLTQLQDFARQGMGVLLITHDLMSAVKICQRITVLRDGQTIETAEVSAFQGRGEALSQAYTKQLWNSLPEHDFMGVGR